jgi:hypothetical protein
MAAARCNCSGFSFVSWNSRTDYPGHNPAAEIRATVYSILLIEQINILRFSRAPILAEKGQSELWTTKHILSLSMALMT